MTESSSSYFWHGLCCMMKAMVMVPPFSSVPHSYITEQTRTNMCAKVTIVRVAYLRELRSSTRIFSKRFSVSRMWGFNLKHCTDAPKQLELILMGRFNFFCLVKGNLDSKRIFKCIISSKCMAMQCKRL